MLLFLKKRPTESVFKKIKVDIHSHLLPGIDDGSPNLNTSIELVKGLCGLGFEKLITTPHIFLDFYPNTSEIIRQGLKQLKEGLAKEKLPLTIEAAAEYYTDSFFEDLLAKDDVLHFGKPKYVLIEMSFISPTPNLEEIIFQLITKGYQPILAHPERYAYWHNHTQVFERLKKMGCLLQLNILSLVSYYGRSVEKKALSMVKSEQIDFLGTDLHHHHHLDILQSLEYDKYLDSLLNKYEFRNNLL